jgi:hypothetical protein
MLKYSNRYAAGLQWQERALIYRAAASVFFKAKLRQQVFWFFASVRACSSYSSTSRTYSTHEPFTSKIREILVRTQRPPGNAFGAAHHTMPFDRVIGDK